RRRTTNPDQRTNVSLASCRDLRRLVERDPPRRGRRGKHSELVNRRKARLNTRQSDGLFSVTRPSNRQDLDQTPDSAVLPQHECGLFGVFGHPNAAVLTYYGLFALQHRGQESAGIVTSNGPGTSFLMHKDMGLVSQVFGQEELARLKGTRAIGHTRY